MDIQPKSYRRGSSGPTFVHSAFRPGFNYLVINKPNQQVNNDIPTCYVRTLTWNDEFPSASNEHCLQTHSDDMNTTANDRRPRIMANCRTQAYGRNSGLRKGQP